MPIYEYQCPACKKRYELQQSFSAETTHSCEKCGKGTAKRILHAPTVVFKGSGFYATDNKAGRVATDSTSDGDSTDSGSSETKTEPKKASTKSETKSKSTDTTSEAAV